ncbi:MAG: hypothetical protein RIR21_156 [Pseudomonadota bacterium]
MSEDKSNQEAKTDQPRPKRTLGREELFDVFKADGEAELFARPTSKKSGIETETRSGPFIQHQIHDSQGPSITHEISDAFGPAIDHSLMDDDGPSNKHAEISDADGPSIAHHMSDGVGPTIKHAEISDANGPSIAHHMSDGVGPTIKHPEISDADGPSIAHHMSDAQGPVIKRALDNTNVKQPTISTTLSSIARTNAPKTNHQPENTAPSQPAHQLDTFSIHMAERIAKMKSAQKETKAKMDQLEASTNELQGEPIPKGKK